MQTGDGYLFYLDRPTEIPGPSETELFGWIAAMKPISEVRLLGLAQTELVLEDRPDVKAAFPGHPHVQGFRGNLTEGDVRGGALRVRFRLGGTAIEVAEPLAPRPVGVSGWARIRARWRAARAKRRLQADSRPSAQWKAGMDLLVSETELLRGSAFGRAEADRILELFARHFGEAVVLQIGANDGFSGDPLAKHFATTQWRGLLVEPVPHLAESLSRRYASNPRITVERSAVSETEGRAKLFRIAEDPKAPAWFQQLASLDRDVLLKHRGAIPDIEGRIVEEAVPVVSVPSLLGKHGLGQIDLLVIDTEGHDYRILRQFDLGRVRPWVLMFEHQHLPPREKEEAFGLLRKNGYRWFETPEGDALAWRTT